MAKIVNDDDKEVAYVLWFHYPDGSGQEVVRVYLDSTRAREDLVLAERDMHKCWELSEVPVFGNFYSPDVKRQAVNNG